MSRHLDSPRASKVANDTAIGLAVLGLVACLGWTSSVYASGSLEHRVKAAYINNFIKFTEWPKSVLPDDARHIVVGFLGGDEVRRAFETSVKDRMVKGRRVQVKKIFKAKDVTPCHLLFVGSGDVKKALKVVENSSALTVGESAGFAAKGGILGLTLVNGKVRFEYNVDAMKKAGLRVQPAILNLGKKVK